MKALHFGPPWGLGSLAVVEVAEPSCGPGSGSGPGPGPGPGPRPGEVLVRMRAASVNYRDLLMIDGLAGAAGGTGPFVPFSDGCGIVEAVGDGVDRFVPGDRVATMFFQGWIDGPPTAAKSATTLVHPLPGVGRELAVYSQDGLSHPPAFLTDAEAACLPCAGVTAWRGLFHNVRLVPGSTVLLIGTGGVSIAGLQFAVASGHRAIVVSSSDAKLERAAALGATHGINYRDHPEWWRQVRALTGGVGVDLVLEVGGAGTLHQALRALRIGGHVALIGLLAAGDGGFDPRALLGTQASLQSIGVGSRRDFEEMCRLIESANIRPVIDRTFDWEDAAAALECVRQGRHFGKVVLTFPGAG